MWYVRHEPLLIAFCSTIHLYRKICVGTTPLKQIYNSTLCKNHNLLARLFKFKFCADSMDESNLTALKKYRRLLVRFILFFVYILLCGKWCAQYVYIMKSSVKNTIYASNGLLEWIGNCYKQYFSISNRFFATHKHRACDYKHSWNLEY